LPFSGKARLFLFFLVQIGLILLLGSEDEDEVLRTEDFIMTDLQKKRITKLRQQGFGYTVIATELKIPVGTVKTFCRRNNLQAGDLASDTQPENISETLPDVGLISAESRGNSTTANRLGKPENTGFSDAQPICEVTVSYADEPDLGAVADVLELLTHASYGGDEKR
jgi:hypothetical protein